MVLQCGHVVPDYPTAEYIITKLRAQLPGPESNESDPIWKFLVKQKMQTDVGKYSIAPVHSTGEHRGGAARDATEYSSIEPV